MKKIKNIKDLTTDLALTYEKVSDGTMPTDQAREISKVAGKLISSAKANLDYNMYMKYKRRIDFLEV